MLNHQCAGAFDYIDASGVLHHLPDPLAGLHVLVSVLKPDGAIGIMTYGALARSGVYPMQQLQRLLTGAHYRDSPVDRSGDKSWELRLLREVRCKCVKAYCLRHNHVHYV